MADEMERPEVTARRKLLEKAATVQRVFATPDGQKLLEFMKQEFFSKLEAKEPHHMHMNLGRADVIAWVEQMMRINPEGR